jgi:two-component system chemotaxis response regulator CheB
MKTIRVLVIDDSALVRKLLTEILESDPAIEVCGTAIDAYAARRKIKCLRPDVLTLDVEMPKMDGITFLRNLMRLHPMPVIMVSTLTQKGAAVTQQALELGALDFVDKPKVDVAHTLEDYRDEIIEKIKMAASARIGAIGLRQGAARPLDGRSPGKPARDTVLDTSVLNNSLIVIGASTGGTEAIKEILLQLPVSMPGILITQHIPALFSAHFAVRMNDLCELTVCEARQGQRIEPGHVYIAPGDRHLGIARKPKGYICQLEDGPPVNRHIPSVDMLFRSAVNATGADTIGVLLTGMGRDGARGLKELQETGARTIVQDESTSVVWGMPGAAVELGAADSILPLGQIADRIMTLLQGAGPVQKRRASN